MKNQLNIRGQLIHKAVIFAEKAHRGQERKGTDISYITHPLEVAQILSEITVKEKLIIAGILHDTVEDTPVTLKDIEDEFGKEVRDLVEAHTEDKTKPWRERKALNIALAKTGPHDVRLLVLADELANLRSIVYDYHRIGEKVWDRFNVSRDDERLYYDELGDAFKQLEQTSEALRNFSYEFTSILMELFAKFYYNESEGVVYLIIDGQESKCRKLAVDDEFKPFNPKDLPESAKEITFNDLVVWLQYGEEKKKLDQNSQVVVCKCSVGL